LHFSITPPSAFPVGLFLSLLGAFRAVGKSRFTLLAALSTKQDTFLFDRLLLLILSFVVGSLLSLPFPFGCTYCTEPAPGYKLPSTGTTGNILLCYRLPYSCRSLEFELIE